MYLRIRVPCLAWSNLCTRKRFFKPYQNERVSAKQAGEQPKTPYKVDLKIPMKMLLDVLPTCTSFFSNPTILKVFTKSFPTKMKPCKFPGEKKRKEEGRRERKGKSHLGSITFKHKNSGTLEAAMFKVSETEACELLKEHCGKFWFFLAR